MDYSRAGLWYFIDMYRVAVVDDERNIRNLISIALQEEGFDAAEYPDGEAAWADFRQDMPDVIVLDIMMPRMRNNFV